MPFSYDLAMLSCAGTGDLITLEDVSTKYGVRGSYKLC
jgi:hypothetical protein